MIDRRDFLRQGVMGAAAIGLGRMLGHAAPLIQTAPQRATFRPYPPRNMPPMSFVYATDELEDPFKTSMSVGRDGIVIPDEVGGRKFSVNARWYVHDFGYVWLAANNGGEFYTIAGLSGKGSLNLNYEFARSRVTRNRDVKARYEKEETRSSPEVNNLVERQRNFSPMPPKRRRTGSAAPASRIGR